MKTIKELILENPNAKLVVCCGENANTGEYSSECHLVNTCGICELTEAFDMLLDRDELEEKLSEILADDERYASLSDKEFTALIEKKMQEYKFENYICVYVGF